MFWPEQSLPEALLGLLLWAAHVDSSRAGEAVEKRCSESHMKGRVVKGWDVSAGLCLKSPEYREVR